MGIENGSGGSGIGVITTFEDGDDGDEFARQIAEVGAKIDEFYATLGATAIVEKSPHPHTLDRLDLRNILPGLGLTRPSEMFVMPLPVDDPSNTLGQYN